MYEPFMYSPNGDKVFDPDDQEWLRSQKKPRTSQSKSTMAPPAPKVLSGRGAAVSVPLGCFEADDSRKHSAIPEIGLARSFSPKPNEYPEVAVARRPRAQSAMAQFHYLVDEAQEDYGYEEDNDFQQPARFAPQPRQYQNHQWNTSSSIFCDRSVNRQPSPELPLCQLQLAWLSWP